VPGHSRASSSFVCPLLSVRLYGLQHESCLAAPRVPETLIGSNRLSP